MAVKPATLLRYRAAHAAFVAWCRAMKRPVNSTHEYTSPSTRTSYVESLYDRGDPISNARYAVFGVSFLLDLSKVATALPLAKKALIGFSKSSPSSREILHRWRPGG